MNKLRAYVLICAVLFSGCATANYTQKGVQYNEKSTQIKTITVMPIDFKVIQISAGGVQEEMDEWAAQAKSLIRDFLTFELSGRNIQLNFIDEIALKSTHSDEWFSEKGLYEAVATSALNHGFKGMNGFEDKINHFDYTLGEEFQSLSDVAPADAVLFIQGFDTCRTTGKFLIDAFMQGASGVPIFYFNPLNMGLVDSKTGELLWFKSNNIIQNVDFKKSKDVEKLIKWFAEDLLIKK